MKKLLLIASIAFSFSNCISQTQLSAKTTDPVIIKNQPGEEIKLLNGSKGAKRATIGPTWTSVPDALIGNGIATNAELSYNTIFPDTNALFTYTSAGGGTTTFAANINSVGTVFDLRSSIYDIAGPYMANKYTITKVDSVRVSYFYRRFNTNNNIVDTMVITTFDRNSITRSFTGIYAGAVDYTTNKFTATGAGSVRTLIPMTANDTGAGQITIGVNKFISGPANVGKWFGATVTYLSGYKGYNHGLPFDTVANFATQKKSNKSVNALRILCLYNASKFVESTTIPTVVSDRIYNFGIVAESRQRYKIPFTGGGIADYYFPAQYTTSHMFPVIEFLVSTNNLAVKNSSKEITLVSVYPNPAKTNSEVLLTLNSVKNIPAVITISDISGKVVRTINTDLVNGANSINISTDTLSKGMYVVNMIGESFTSSSKLVIE